MVWSRQTPFVERPWVYLTVGITLYFGVAAIALAVLGREGQFAAAVAGSIAVAAWVGPAALARVQSQSDGTWQVHASPDPRAGGAQSMRRDDSNAGLGRVGPSRRALAESSLAQLAAWALMFAATAAVSATVFAGSLAIAGFAVASAAVLLGESLAVMRQETLKP